MALPRDLHGRNSEEGYASGVDALPSSARDNCGSVIAVSFSLDAVGFEGAEGACGRDVEEGRLLILHAWRTSGCEAKMKKMPSATTRCVRPSAQS